MADGNDDSIAHLHPDVVRHLSASRDERVREIQRERFVENAKTEVIWKRVRDLMLRPNGNASNASLLLYAESGVGKTELLKYVAEQIAEEIDMDLKAGKSPWLTMPLQFLLDGCSTEDVLLARLSGGLLTGRRSHKENIKNLEDYVGTWNRLSNSGLFLDELSDVGKGTSMDQQRICQALRMILNRYRRPLVATSNLEAEEIFTMDRNLATRLEPIRISRWEPDEKLRDFLLQLFEFKPLRFAPDFSPDDWKPFLGWLYERTEGITREITRLTNRAAICAIDSKAERMCFNVFREAFAG